MHFKQTITLPPFKQWLWQDIENKRILWFAVITMAASLAWLKYLSPYPYFMQHESYSYLKAAQNNDFINIWPIGYSKFLRLVSVFTRSHIVLVAIQYVLLIASVLYFLFTIRYLLIPDKWLFRIISIVTVINPMLPYTANFVTSDSLFATVSILWFTQLLWILYQPNTNLLLLHGLVVMLAFTVRLMAAYYPFISLLLIVAASMNSRKRWVGIISLATGMLVFIGRTQYEYKKRTEIVQFSAFEGWQLAANSLYGYAYDKPDTIEMVPAKFRELHPFVNNHMDSIRQLNQRPDKDQYLYYLWNFKSPLVEYTRKQVLKYKTEDYFAEWARQATLLRKYGKWLILHHPKQFLIHFVWPNLLNYYEPPAFSTGAYNSGEPYFPKAVVSWFNWEDNKSVAIAEYKHVFVASIVSSLLTVINPAFLVASLFFLSFGGFGYNNSSCKKILICTWLVWFSNMALGVLSAPIELRHQAFPTIITIPFLLSLTTWLVKSLNFNSSSKQTNNSLLNPTQ